jgi:hypothetical protein
MSLCSSPSASRGTIVVQPSYFTSSLYVDPLRQDISHLTRIFAEQYVQSNLNQPFALFRTLWHAQGWPWLHFKVFDSASRHSFLKVTARLFMGQQVRCFHRGFKLIISASERLATGEPTFARVVGLFALYTFFSTQLSCSTPPIYSIQNIPIYTGTSNSRVYRVETNTLADTYTSLLSLPALLTTEYLSPLQPHTTYILSTLIDSKVFQIIPVSSLHAHNPRELPRERFIHDNEVVVPDDAKGKGKADAPKKKGRPTKRDRAKKAKGALASLEKWLDKTAYTPLRATNPISDEAGDGISEEPVPPLVTTHILLSNPPSKSRNSYQIQKTALIDSITKSSTQGEGLLERANQAILARMRKIDQMAAEKGLEVGGEGGERTGLARVEKAVAQMDSTARREGLLGLLEGRGMDP